MALHFCSLVWSLPKGKALTAIWATGLSACFVAAVSKYRQQKKAKELRKKHPKKKKSVYQQGLVSLLTPLLKIAFPRVSALPSIHLVLYTVLLCARILLTIKIAKITGSLGKTVGARTFDKMFELQVVFGLWCMPAAVVNSFLHFENSQMALSIRQNLVQHAHKLYLNDLVYYRAANLGNDKIEDVDQRITQDIKKFCSQLTEVYGNLLKPILEVLLYSKTLASLMGGRQLMGFFMFFFIAGQFLKFIMPPFSALTAETQKREGEFRSHHHRIIGHAEEIAFYGGGERELSIIENSFSSVTRILHKTFFLRSIMGIVDQYLVKH